MSEGATVGDVSPGDIEQCPVCEEDVNHVIANGFRNTWPPIAKVWVCTPEDSDWMFVHVSESEGVVEDEF